MSQVCTCYRRWHIFSHLWHLFDLLLFLQTKAKSLKNEATKFVAPTKAKLSHQVGTKLTPKLKQEVKVESVTAVATCDIKSESEIYFGSKKSTLAARNLLSQQKTFPESLHFPHSTFFPRVLSTCQDIRLHNWLMEFSSEWRHYICIGPLICNCDTFDTGVSKYIQV